MKQTFQVLCTVSVSHKFESLHAHVELDGEVEIHPGDEVCVLGPPINPPYGEEWVERRRVSIKRASWIERAWTRFVGYFECVELLEVSFSDRRQL